MASYSTKNNLIKNIISLFFPITFIMTGCVTRTSITPTNTVSTFNTSPTKSLVASTSTVTPIPTITRWLPSSTPIPTKAPTATQIAVQSNWPGGGLWVYFPTGFEGFRNAEYRVYTPEGNLLATVSSKSGCRGVPSLGSARILCDDGVTIYLFDLETGKTYPSPRFEGEIRTVQNGKDIFFYFLENQDSSCIITRYDVENQVVTHYTPPIVGWVNEFTLSPDGDHFVVAGFTGKLGYHAFELYKGQDGYNELDPHSQYFLGNLSWSADSTQLIYGISSDKSSNPDEFFVFDYKTGLNRLLVKAPQGKFFDLDIDKGIDNVGKNTVWSPDGKFIALSMGNEICISELKSSKTTCTQVAEIDERIFRFYWSPDSSQLAIVTTDKNSINNYIGDKLAIFTLTDHSLKILFENKGIGAIFWR